MAAPSPSPATHKPAWSSTILLWLGVLGLMHSAYSVTEYRHNIKLQSEEFSGLPTDILLECFVSFVMALYAVVAIKVSELLPIDAVFNLNQKTPDEVFVTPSFHTFRHRGRFLFAKS
eukprot:m.588405 g.588405  ORF g.588405 m.588405 type:complete len:117 (+) comp22364_c0_seq5:269-619(+)